MTAHPNPTRATEPVAPPLEAEPAGPCPACAAPLTRVGSWPVWCPACDWNLRASAEPEPPAGRFANAAREIGDRLGTRLFDELAQQPIDARPQRDVRASASLLLAHALALGVHLSSVLVAIAAIWLWWQPWPNLLVALVALALPLVAWTLRPRRIRPPKGDIARAEFPMLHTLADRAAQALGTAPADSLVVSTELNAWIMRSTWPARRHVGLGLPLLMLLRPEERAAVIAHEFAHGVNGDPLRGRFLFSAVDSLFQWGELLRPTRIGDAGRDQMLGPLISLGAIPIELVLLAASQCVFWLARGMLVLVYRESQRAEYLADRLAASVAGAGATRSMLQALSLLGAADDAMHAAALEGRLAPLAALLPALRREIPASEVERRDRLSRRERWRVDATHPPTALRIDMLARTPVAESAPLLSAAEEAQLEAELARLAPEVERELTNHYVVGLNG